MLSQIVLSTELKIVASVIVVVLAAIIVAATSGGFSFATGLLSRITSAKPVNKDKPLSVRSADQPAPTGTAEYLRDLYAAAPEAPAEFLLKQALDGSTVAKCQRDWIVELLKQRKGGAA